jgi:hypothetical protein
MTNHRNAPCVTLDKDGKVKVEPYSARRDAVVLAIVTLPSSYSRGLLFEAWPDFFSLPFGQAGYMILCGLAQAWFMSVLKRRFQRSTKQK